VFEQIPIAGVVTAVKAKKEIWETKTEIYVIRDLPFSPSAAPLAPGMERR
jgi:hypothetical protein